MYIFKWIKLKKYYYDIFLRPLTPFNRFKVMVHKIKGRVWLRNMPQSLEIGVTYQCQLHCVHCGVHGQQKLDKSELNLAEIKESIRQAHALGVYLVIFSGGEPLLRPDITECVDFASYKGLIPAISTNGQMLTYDIAHRLKKKGIVFMNISIDSADSLFHDMRRGQIGCFQKACEAIQLCAQEGISAIVSTYATKENISNGDLKKIISLAKSLDAQGVRILLSVPAGRWLGCSELILSEQEKQYIHELLDPLYVYVEGICNKFTECNAALKKLFYISPYGDVQPCSFVPVYFGNIHQTSLENIWKQISQHHFYNKFDGSDCIMRDTQFYRYYADIFQERYGELPIKI